MKSCPTELLAPAGNFETALAAFAAGADAVYCGLSDFSARAFADNFALGDLKNLLRYAHHPLPSTHYPLPSKKIYVTFNTLIDEGNLETAIEWLSQLDAVRPDALIVQDLGVARICRKYFPNLQLHASTQLVAHNLEGVLALREIGFKRVVLARELSLEEIASIQQRCGDVELEVFIHGALCYSISGLCLFGAMEKGRSGNRGTCPYCCRQGYEVESSEVYPFSMKDLRLGEDVKKLAQIGVASLKIEGRMKSPLYVASVTKYYRQILGGGDELEKIGGGGQRNKVSVADLETVFSRRTTELLFNGKRNASPSPDISDSLSPIDSESLGHRGTPIGTVKRVTKDREGRAWLRFHTMRALEKHDGLQFDALTDEGRHFGFGIAEMRQAISRAPVFEVVPGADVEVLLPEVEKIPIREGDTVYCSMSNAVKRAFPVPSFRPSDYPGTIPLNLTVTLTPTAIHVAAEGLSDAVSHRVYDSDGSFPADAVSHRVYDSDGSFPVDAVSHRVYDSDGSFPVDAEALRVTWTGHLESAKAPEKTQGAIEKAFSKLGETDYFLAHLTLIDNDHLFAPASILNDLRRDLVERLDDAREKARVARLDAALKEDDSVDAVSHRVYETDGSFPVDAEDLRVPLKTLKLRIGQAVPAGDWDEIIVSISPSEIPSAATPPAPIVPGVRLALPVWNGELSFNRLRTCVKGLIRAGYTKWECSDLATLRLLEQVGVTDIVADWSLYAFNSAALAELSERGVRRFVASPENNSENLAYLRESGYAIEFLAQQSTPLFISRHRPAAMPDSLAIYPRGDLWVTVKPVPRTFASFSAAPTRIDLSWDPGNRLVLRGTSKTNRLPLFRADAPKCGPVIFMCRIR